MKPGFRLLVVILVALSPLKARAQFLRELSQPVDQTKQADVNQKTLSFGEVPLNTLSQPTKDLAGSPLTKGDLKLQQLDQKKAEFNTLPMPTVSEPLLPQANFTAKKAVADFPNDKTAKQAEETAKKAPVTDRQIKPFTPAGEEELKHQLNDSPREH